MFYNRTVGFWIMMIIGILIIIMLFIGQMMSFINYEFTVSIGLQESANDIGPVGVSINKAFGVGDTIIYAPLLIIGLLGLWKQKAWGIYAMASSLGITVYWPIVNLFIILYAEGSPEFNYPNFTSVAIILVLISIYGMWGLLYLYINRELLTLKKIATDA